MSELTESLRYCATNNSCEYCPRHKYQYESVIACAEQMLNEAADTIENQNNLLDLNTQRCEALRGQLRDSHESYEKHLNEIESQVPRWIPVTERLPDEGEYVLIWVGNVQVARIEKGISKQERELMKEGAFPDPIEYGWTYSLRRIGRKRSDCYRACDEDGNNKVPYKWYANGGPMAWFGQEVTHWMPLPKAPDLT